MKKKLYPQKSCKWVIEAKWNEASVPTNKREANWFRVSHFALADGRTYYNVPISKPSRPMAAYPLEVLIEKARAEQWNSYYEFRFKNIKTKETIPFALFPEIAYGSETHPPS